MYFPYRLQLQTLNIQRRCTLIFSKYKPFRSSQRLASHDIPMECSKVIFHNLKCTRLSYFVYDISCVQMLSTKETEILFSLNLLSPVHAKKTTSLHPGISS